MKPLISLLLIILLICSTFSFSVNKIRVRRDEGNKLVKRVMNVSVNRNTLNISTECRNDLNKSSEYKECSDIKFTKSDYEYLCSTLNSTKCKKFFKDPLSFIPNCKNDKVIVELHSKPMIAINMASISFMCTKDGNGKICPAAEASLNGKNIGAEAINQTCRSRKCIKRFSELLKTTVDNINELQTLSISKGEGRTTKNIYSALYNNLNSEQCISQAINDLDSSGISLKINSSILLSFITLLFYLF